ncbi:MAG: tripartite tricarboxylate transporter permease [Bacillota bacterium]
MQYVLAGLLTVMQPANMLAIVVGVFIGMVFGMVPGLSGVTAVSLLVPFTYGMPPITGILLMVGVYCAATYGGSITAILFNIPGDVMAAATAKDGYPLTRKGEARRALSMAIYASCVGGLFGTLVLATVAPQFVKVALAFGSPEYFALAVLGLTVVASLGMGSTLKALLSAALGLLLATVGLCPVSGVSRFTFGQVMLQAGISFIPAIIGLFAISEVLSRMYDREIQTPHDPEAFREARRFSIPSISDIMHTRWTIARSSVIGTVVGMLPGAGATIAAFLGYGIAQRSSDKPETFGQGNILGVAAPESANNAAVGGAMVPLLTLGIPGSASTAVILAVFILHGLRPGPLLFIRFPVLTYAIFVGMFVANLVMLFMAIALVRYLVRVLVVRYEVLSMVILAFCIVGAFAINNRLVDVWVALFCGAVGFFAKKYGYSPAAIVLGLVLGPIAEDGFINGMTITGGDLWVFLSRPVTAAILGLALLSLAFPTWVEWKKKKATLEKASST